MLSSSLDALLNSVQDVISSKTVGFTVWQNRLIQHQTCHYPMYRLFRRRLQNWAYKLYNTVSCQHQLPLQCTKHGGDLGQQRQLKAVGYSKLPHPCLVQRFNVIWYISYSQVNVMTDLQDLLRLFIFRIQTNFVDRGTLINPIIKIKYIIRLIYTVFWGQLCVYTNNLIYFE